jgi:hypothetical protein
MPVKVSKTFLIFLTTNLTFLIVVGLVVSPVWKRSASDRFANFAGLLPTSNESANVNSWTSAVEKVKEDRGEPMGKQAKIEVPSELKHYSDTRRFLATQVAEVKEEHVGTPQDFVELANMIERGELVQVPPISDNFILFGVGGNADRQPFTRFQNGHSINIYNEAGLRQEYDRIARSQSNSAAQLVELKKQLAGLKRRERTERKKLQTQIAAIEKTIKLDRDEKALLDRYYGTPATRLELFAEYESLQRLGTKLSGSAFNMADATARQQTKVRMLSSLRPEALKVLEGIAASYHEKFGRPLPVTSLVRPDEYQLTLSKTNPNATRIDTPPHSTGLAFDILYRYMTADEQLYVMSELARLKDEGQIEVLRENRDHYHVFAFVDGTRPREEMIAASLGDARRPKAVEKDATAERGHAKPHQSKRTAEAHHSVRKVAPAKQTGRKVTTKPRTRNKGRR